jgi:hypothetical protein
VFAFLISICLYFCVFSSIYMHITIAKWIFKELLNIFMKNCLATSIFIFNRQFSGCMNTYMHVTVQECLYHCTVRTWFLRFVRPTCKWNNKITLHVVKFCVPEMENLWSRYFVFSLVPPSALKLNINMNCWLVVMLLLGIVVEQVSHSSYAVCSFPNLSVFIITDPIS